MSRSSAIRSAIGETAGSPFSEANLPEVATAPADSARLLHVADDEGAARAGVGERAGQDAGVGDDPRPVAEGDGAGIPQEPDLGHLAAGARPWSAPPSAGR